MPCSRFRAASPQTESETLMPPIDPFAGEPVRVGPWWEWPNGGKMRVISGGDGDVDDGGSLNDALNAAGKAAADRIEGDDGGDDDEDLDDDLDDDDDKAALEAGAKAAKAARQKKDDKADKTEPKEGEPVPFDEHKKLRDENASYRKKWAPFEKAFGELGDGARLILDADPEAAADIAYLARQAGTMHPDDKRWLQSVTALAETDPAEASRMMVAAAKAYREGVPADDDKAKGKKAEADGEDDDEDDDEPVTRAELKAWEKSQSDARENERNERVIAQQTERIHDEMKTLGYDLDSKDEIERARASTLIELARQDPEGSLQNAHEKLETWEQSIIDKAMGKKRKEAARTTSPGGGSSPSGEKALESMEDAAAAMDARLEGAGIAPRRRS